MEESRHGCADENLEGQGNFGLGTSRHSSPPRTCIRPPTERRSTPTDDSTLLEPPVTKKTLSELDVNKIVHNPKLRHDINFDPDLHFRPNP